MLISDMYGYNSSGESTFLKITVSIPKLVATTKRLLYQGFRTPTYPEHVYHAFESFIDFEIRLVSSFGKYNAMLWHCFLSLFSLKKIFSAQPCLQPCLILRYLRFSVTSKEDALFYD